ncbi:MAG: hypothetical protein QM790_11645 [Nibricoccus sp.]
MSKPASKFTRVTLVLLCLMAVAVGVFFCSRRAVETKETNPTVIPKDAAKLVTVNDGTCSWRVTVALRNGGEPQQWKLEIGKSKEVILPAGDYDIEQRLLAEAGGSQARRFQVKLEAGEVYRWRLVNVLSSDSQELRIPVEGSAAP